MKPLWTQSERLVVKLCKGTLLDVAVNTNRLIAVNMEICALYYIMALNYVLCFPRLLTDITNFLRKTFARIYTNGLWTFLGQIFIGYGYVVPKQFEFPSTFTPMNPISAYWRCPTDRNNAKIFVSTRIFDMCTFRLRLISQATKRPLLAAVLREFPCFHCICVLSTH